MTFGPPNTMETALPVNVTFEKDYNKFLEQWTGLYRKVADKVNDKERAFYPNQYEDDVRITLRAISLLGNIILDEVKRGKK